MSRRNCRARFALACASALLVSSCSYVSDFVVVNRSAEPVEVQYAFKERFASASCCPLAERPQRMAAQDLGGDAPWTPVGEDEYVYHPAAARVTVLLRPGEALRIARLNNYTGHERGEDESFAVKSVRLTGAGGTVFYEGLQAQTAFAEAEPDLYTLTYR